MSQGHTTRKVSGETKSVLAIELTRTEQEKLDRLAVAEGVPDTTEWAKRILLSMTDLLVDDL